LKVQHEIKKLKMMSPMSAEATVVRNYIDWIMSLPWYEKTRDTLDITEAERNTGRGSLRPGKAQGAHPGVPGRSEPG
jgi:ATP-dependent Lon protease